MGLVAYDNKEHLVKVSTIIPRVEISKTITTGNNNSTITNIDGKISISDTQGNHNDISFEPGPNIVQNLNKIQEREPFFIFFIFYYPEMNISLRRMI